MENFRAPEVFPERLEFLALKVHCGLVWGSESFNVEIAPTSPPELRCHDLGLLIRDPACSSHFTTGPITFYKADLFRGQARPSLIS